MIYFINKTDDVLDYINTWPRYAKQDALAYLSEKENIIKEFTTDDKQIGVLLKINNELYVVIGNTQDSITEFITNNIAEHESIKTIW